MNERDTRRGNGVLLPRADSPRLRSSRWDPHDPALAPTVEALWFGQWDLGEGSRDVRTLPGPQLQIVFEPRASKVVGISTDRFVRTLRGRGIVLGVKVQPGMWSAFSSTSAAALTDRQPPIREVTSIDPSSIEAQLGRVEPRVLGREVEALLRSSLRPVRPSARRAHGWVELVRCTPAITSVDALVDRTGVNKRTLQRSFRQQVGVPPKWVIRRYRLHEAVERVGAGQHEGLASLAFELGYADQAHFTRDFVAATGHTPSAYAEAMRSGA